MASLLSIHRILEPRVFLTQLHRFTAKSKPQMPQPQPMQEGFSPVSWVRLQTYKFTSHTHDTQTRNYNLWSTQSVVPCRNRTRATLHGNQLPSHRANRAVNSPYKAYLCLTKRTKIVFFISEIYYNENQASSDEEWTYEPLKPHKNYDSNIYNI
uniref:SFRICE_013648 n=1 Tax=Spodoptera frugiperda TaxID=7108 RepID=A0A2H1WU01_SPOFR